ncbi:MAG: hypothetical protein LBG58_03850 [Planctomycetaceae bacterium]|jgi:hypothetical protein|nr:hypothetical protein [Planctomycetaceae bacterium]
MIIEIIVMVEVIKAAEKTKMFTETLYSGNSTKRLIIGKLYVPPPPFPILTFGEGNLTRL